ncbi:type I glyceraldehyde-3-phosphate dehydrogenase [Acidipropionibacterium acidipropionici]|uniref:Glyceraldehyde-3-phosphate dehydrogenase n=1 Tax=Acidipropionibacterium acidipropionici TaxID=1748 RepID=A0AAC9AP51_9ACTN|nr:type I glyceraldehyde-3-phosphate dehydrogenase [Acidipropionibacterium acidipropionici]AMS06549.1 glyceraldehyde-3-phosphate dehydrogenase [Acidipropionibacterium acidipropionici]AOZ47991.1 type I glyceraldehyde-3-phosphate dehydrogenase [Acidipropionibacterium acidipropionici]AZP38659.1 type I glyceraldehyde-3-phosphate dehydrogenase [Acidipropionibacterium acidipropionici]
MTVRIGINGFGRIGRTYLRAALANDADVEVVAVNDLTDAATLADLLEWDSISGHLDQVTVEGSTIHVGDRSIAVLSEPDPAAIGWGEVGADVVIESTGRFTDGQKARAHLSGGAKKVIVSAPAKGDVPTFVLGVNDDTLDPSAADVFSNGSCTTNSLAPLAKVLNDSFGIESGLMTTVHAYTGDQRLHDAPHKDLRRARAAALSTIPTTSGAAKAIGTVIPELDGRLTGFALRVPVPVGSITDLTAVLDKTVSVDDVNAAFKEASESQRLGRYLQYSTAPIVSADIVGNPYSSIYDAPLTKVAGRQVKVLGWYDNEWGFSNRLVEFSERIGSAL